MRVPLVAEAGGVLLALLGYRIGLDFDLPKFHTASELKDDITGKLPQKVGTIVVDFDIHGQKTLWRVYEHGEGIAGDWLLNPVLVSNVKDNGELFSKIGVLPKSWKVEYSHVGKLETSKVPAETDGVVRVSIAGKIADPNTGEHARGQATQFRLVSEQRVDSGWSEVAPLDEIFGVDND